LECVLKGLIFWTLFQTVFSWSLLPRVQCMRNGIHFHFKKKVLSTY
jgi:hypothetical protein